MADMTGKTLGKYRLIERLGRGGMAEVYRAYQPRLERDVAVKVMFGYLAEDEKFVGRFEREAKAVAALHHPHIVQIHDFDVEDDVYYMVMEYIGGETLKARLKRLNAAEKRMPLDEVARIFRALCDALDYAHAQGCIHRDIKPANVMFDGERLVLTDFGIASIVGGTRYTASGAMVGTPAYMSPEQGQGDPGDVRSDVYSLGVILYEMVTGRLPYDADTPLAVILKHLSEPLPLPSQVCADVLPAVERVILKALAKAPDDRYQSAGALAGALEAAVESVEVPAEALPPLGEPRVDVARPAPVAEPAPPRKRMPWALVGVTALAVVALAVAALLILPDRGGEPAPAVAPTQAIPSTDAVAHYEAGVAAFHEEDYDIAIQELTQAIEADPQFAEAYYWRGVVYAQGGSWAEAEADLSQAIALQPDLAEAYSERGRLYLHNLERPEDALADYTAAIELKPEFAEAYIERAKYYLWYADDEEPALADLDRALELAPDLAEAWGLRGELYFGREEYDLALSDLTRAVELDPENGWAWQLIGATHYWLGEYEQAIASYDKTIELDPGDLDAYYDRAFAYLGTGDLEAALEDLDRVLLLEPEHSGAHYGRGRVHAAAGRYEEAIADLTEVIKDKERGYEWPYFQEDNPYIDRALAYQALGRAEEALADLDTLIEEDPYWHLPYYHRGLIYKELGQIEAAQADFKALWENAPNEEWQRKAEEELAATPQEAITLMDDFESGNFDDRWWFYTDEGTVSFACKLAQPGHASAHAMRLTFETGVESWPGCAIDVDPDQWRNAEGLSFFWRADQSGLRVVVILEMIDPTQTNPEAGGRTPFKAVVQTPGKEWTPITLAWDDFAKAEWVGEGGLDVLDLTRIAVLHFQADAGQSGSVWVDDLQLLLFRRIRC